MLLLLLLLLQELAESDGIGKVDQPWDRLVVECSGVAEPQSIAAELEAMTLRKEPIMQKIFLAGIVCVVDASCFRSVYESTELLSLPVTPTSSGRGLSGAGPLVPLASLYVKQLEEADIVVVNKTDLLPSEDLPPLLSLLDSLNGRARYIEATPLCPYMVITA